MVAPASPQCQFCGQMAQIRRGKGQFDDAIEAIDCEPLVVVWKGRQVQVDHADPASTWYSKAQLDTPTIGEDGAMICLCRQFGSHMCKEAMHNRNVMDECGEEAIAQGALFRFSKFATGTLAQLLGRQKTGFLPQGEREVA